MKDNIHSVDEMNENDDFFSPEEIDEIMQKCEYSLYQHHQKALERKKRDCEILKQEVLAAKYMLNGDCELPIPEGLKEKLLFFIHRLEISDSLKCNITFKIDGSAITIYSLESNSLGIVYNVDEFSDAIPGLHHRHFLIPEIILFKFSLLFKEQKKKQK